MNKFSFSLLTAIVFSWASSLTAQNGYFQQEANYEIHVSLDDQKHFLNGTWELEYVNHSEVSLDSILLHLYPNAYRDKTSAFAKQQLENGSTEFHYSSDEDKGYIDSLEFWMEGNVLQWGYYNGQPDIAVIYLKGPLAPGMSATITSTFRVKIPKTISRFGHVGQQYQVSQWYPKPAVFDPLGWHPIPYLDQGEFYGEYGTFDVYIDVPKNYVVGATGDLPENDPELKWLSEREKLSREKLNASAENSKFEQAFAADERKTLHFHQEKVHDFAWFADKDYFVLSENVKLPISGRTVHCVAMFNAKDKVLWKKGAEFVGKAVLHYSKYAGEYPYNHATAVDGALGAGGGMEYPNITVLSAGGSEGALEEVILHEVGHNWFYGILGSNEREHPWMDEGVNTYFENKYVMLGETEGMQIIPKPVQKKLGIDLNHTRMLQEAYNISAMNNTDQPIELNAGDYTQINYGTIVYMKTGLAFRYLGDYLGLEIDYKEHIGEVVIDRCFHAYFDEWKFKHPQPEDMQRVFERVSGKDLSWFFEDLVKGNEKLDFRIQKFSDESITIKNFAKGTYPVSVSIEYEGGIETKWTEPFTGEITIPLSEKGKKAWVNSSGDIPEVHKENNSLKSSGLFPRCKPWKLKFGFSWPNPNKTTFNFVPTLGYNATDGFLLGGMIYHNIFPEKHFEFYVNAMYGFGSSSFCGSKGETYHFYPTKVFRKIDLSSKSALFSDLLRTKNSISFFLKEKNLRKPLNQIVSINLFHLAMRGITTNWIANYQQPIFGTAEWKMNMARTLSNFSASAEIGTNIIEKVYRFGGTVNYSRNLTKKITASFRVFGGMFAGDPAPWLLQYRLSGSGDPFGQIYMADRNHVSDGLSHQVVSDHGAFRSMTGVSFNKSILAANFDINLPIKLFHVFAAVGTGSSTFLDGSQTYYEAGVSLNFFKQAFRMNFPVVGSAYSSGVPGDFGDFWSNITFSLDPGKLMSLVNARGLF